MPDAFKLMRHSLVGGYDLVKGIGNLPREPDLITRQANGEIPEADRAQYVQQRMLVERTLDVTITMPGLGNLTVILEHRRGARQPVGASLGESFTRCHDATPVLRQCKKYR